MSKKSLNTAPAAAVENQMSNNNNAVTYTDASGRALDLQPSEVIESDEGIAVSSVTAETSSGSVIGKFYTPQISEGMESVSVSPDKFPAWFSEIPGSVSDVTKVRAGQFDGAQTYYSLEVVTSDGRVVKFRNANGTQIKAYFGLVTIQRGTGESRIVAKTDEEVISDVQKSFDKGMEYLDKAAKCFNVFGLSVEIDDVYNWSAVLETMSAMAFAKNEDNKRRIEEAKTKAAEREAQKEADAKLKELKGERKKVAAAVANMSEIQLALMAAVAAGNMEEVTRLSQLQLQLQKAEAQAS